MTVWLTRELLLAVHDEQIAERRRLPEICQMTAMKQIKAAVGEYHTAADRCGLRSQGEQLL